MIHLLKKNTNRKKSFAIGKTSVPFNPLNANTVAYWDADTLSGAYPVRWVDLVGGIDLFFSVVPPTLNVGALNGHDTVTFDGIVNSGNATAPVVGSPYTVYFVIKLNDASGLNFAMDDGVNSNVAEVEQSPLLRQLAFRNSGGQIVSDIVGTSFKVITIILDGSSSGIRVDLNTIVTGTLDDLPRDGLTIGSDVASANFLPCDYADIIIRDVVDSTNTQNNFINFLKNKFAI